MAFLPTSSLIRPFRNKSTYFLVFALAFYGCSAQVDEKTSAIPGIPVPAIDASAPLTLSEEPEDKELCEKAVGLAEDRGTPHEKWGLMFVSLADGRALCHKEPRALFGPASVQKIVTAALALEKLGSEFRFKTSVYSKRKVEKGTIEGDLVLYGRGAPDFDKNALSQLVTDLKKKGLNSIRGDIIGDSSYFKADGLGDGWTWNEAQWYYGAAASALSYERNLVKISVKNGKPSADSEYVDLTGELQPAEEIEAIGVKRRLGTNEVYIWGQGTNLDARIAVSNPVHFAARVFKEVLEEAGITVEGEARSADWTGPTGAETGVELASVESDPLSAIIRTMNKDSVNLYAELILRTLGKKFGIQAPDPDPKLNKLRGDDAAGAAVVKKYLGDNGIETASLAIHDGSGLSRLDRMTPESIVRTLILAAGGIYAKTFTDSLPVSGTDGTLRGRLQGIKGRVSAKTGSIKYANSLAGYLKRGDETIAFAVFCNDETTRDDSTETIDEIVGLFSR